MSRPVILPWSNKNLEMDLKGLPLDWAKLTLMI
jgi:hypothetical protein